MQPPEIFTATILITDVVDSTATRISLGEDAADRLFASHRKLLISVARAHRSQLIRNGGDGIVAVFPSATDAFRAAMAIEAAVAAENERGDPSCEIRAGISSGDVRWMDGDVDGIPLVEAARLAARAERGQILCAEISTRLAAGRDGLEFKEVGWLDLKGIDKPVLAFETLWWQTDTRSARRPGWLHSNQILPLVGRDQELAALESWLDGPCRGPSLRLLTGPAGIGKTRLIAEATDRATASGHIVLVGRCTDPATSPFQVLTEALVSLVDSAPATVLQADPPPALAHLVPDLRRGPFNLTPPEPADSETDYFNLVAAVAAFLQRLSELHPLLLVLDDLHWSSGASLRLLASALRQIERGEVRVLATTRDTSLDQQPEAQRQMKALLALPDVQRLPLEPLVADDIAAVLAGDPVTAHDPATVAAQVIDLTGGNAFLVTETVRELRETGALAPGVMADSIALFIAGRVDRVGPIARELIQVAAAAEGAEIGLLRHALGAAESELVVAVEEALETGSIVEQAAGVYGPAHDLARSAILSGLSSIRMTSLHRRIAAALLAEHPDAATTLPYRLARHLVRVAAQGERGDVTRAVAAAVDAARFATAHLAHPEAAGWYQQALDLLARHPAPAGPDDQSADHAAAELTLALGEAQWRSGDRNARATLVAAGRQARQLDRVDLLCAAARAGNRGFFSMTATTDPGVVELLEATLGALGDDEPAIRAEVLAILAAELTWAADGDRRFALADEALELARRSGDLPTLTMVLSMRNVTISAADTLEQRRRDSEELATIAADKHDDLLAFHATLNRTNPLIELGETAAITTLLDEAGRLATSLAQPRLQWIVAFSHAALCLMTGDLEEAERRAEQALHLGNAAGQKLEAIAFYSEQIAEVRRLQGRLGELVDGMRAAAAHLAIDPAHAVLRFLAEADAPEVEELFEQALTRQGLPPRRDLSERAALDNLAFVAAKLHRPREQALLYEALTPHAGTFGHTTIAHHCGHHYLALLAAALGRHDAAAAHFAAAAERHEQADTPLLLVESLLDWSSFARARGASLAEQRHLRARAHLALGDRPAELLRQRLAAQEATDG